MWSPLPSARLFAELARERSDDAVDQVPMAVRWAEDAPAPERGVKRPRDWASPPRERACLPAPPGVAQEQPPLPTRQFATTGTPPGSPLVPRRSMSVLRNPIWEAMFEMMEPEDDVPRIWRTDSPRHYGPPEEDPNEYDLAELVPELTPLPIVRQNATVGLPTSDHCDRSFIRGEMDVE